MATQQTVSQILHAEIADLEAATGLVVWLTPNGVEIKNVSNEDVDCTGLLAALTPLHNEVKATFNGLWYHISLVPTFKLNVRKDMMPLAFQSAPMPDFPQIFQSMAESLAKSGYHKDVELDLQIFPPKSFPGFHTNSCNAREIEDNDTPDRNSLAYIIRHDDPQVTQARQDFDPYHLSVDEIGPWFSVYCGRICVKWSAQTQDLMKAQ
jgi:hypothetical protein